jgi:sugar (pentulose or hexulose) kinase
MKAPRQMTAQEMTLPEIAVQEISESLPYWIGIDLGTSGCRAVAVDARGVTLADARVALPPPERPAPGWSQQDPAIWWAAVCRVLRALAAQLPGRRSAGLAVDGTSASLLLAALDGTPLGPALMYNDRRAITAAAVIDRAAPAQSPARGPTSSLAKLIHLAAEHTGPYDLLALHQADWVSGRLAGRCGRSDWNNALKLGFDATGLLWPEWVRTCLPTRVRLPKVVAPGHPIGTLDPALADALGLSSATVICAGTTDSTAAVIAAGVGQPGDAVSCLGSTLVLKLLSPQPIDSARHGVYSHRFGDSWLVGGASNSGGAVLLQHFSLDEIRTLSAQLDTTRTSGLDYYPLPGPGERFPRYDPTLAPRLAPRPADRGRFLHGLLEGMAAIEADGYRLLRELGAPPPRRVISIGGGAANPAWTALRERALGVPVVMAEHQEAAYGSACLALRPWPGTSASCPDRT